MEGLREQELRTLVGFAHDAARIARFEPRRLERWLVERVGELIPADTVHVQVSGWPRQVESFPTSSATSRDSQRSATAPKAEPSGRGLPTNIRSSSNACGTQ